MATRVRDANETVRRDVRELDAGARREGTEFRNEADLALHEMRSGGHRIVQEKVHHSHPQQHGNANPFEEEIRLQQANGVPRQGSVNIPMSYQYVKVHPYHKYYEPVIRDVSPFSPDEDAKVLHKAMKGMGTDEKTIINILTNRSNQQRQIIAKQFQLLYKKDLVKELKSELSGKLEDTVVALMQPPEVFDAHSLHNAITGLRTDEKTLIEIIGSRTPQELSMIKREYNREFKKDLEKDVSGDTSGFFRNLLLARLQSSEALSRSGNVYEVSPKQAYHEAQALWETGPKHWEKDEPFFGPIFVNRSEEHLRQVFQDYRHIGHIDIDKDIEKELSGDTREMLLAFVKVAKNRPLYFAERLQSAMKGMGVDAKTVIRIIVSRAEKDLGNIKKEYARLTGKPLEDAIAHEFSGDNKRVLLSVLDPQQIYGH